MTSRATGLSSAATADVVERFMDAFNRQDARRVEALLSDDTVFEDTSPPPDGTRYQGKSAVAGFWTAWFARNPGARFETEDLIVSEDRAVVCWRYAKMRNGQPWHIRGVDVLTVRDGKIASKLAYVKG